MKMRRLLHSPFRMCSLEGLYLVVVFPVHSQWVSGAETIWFKDDTAGSVYYPRPRRVMLPLEGVGYTQFSYLEPAAYSWNVTPADEEPASSGSALYTKPFAGRAHGSEYWPGEVVDISITNVLPIDSNPKRLVVPMIDALSGGGFTVRIPLTRTLMVKSRETPSAKLIVTTETVSPLVQPDCLLSKMNTTGLSAASMPIENIYDMRGDSRAVFSWAMDSFG